MSFHVHLHVCFTCDTNDGIAKLAGHHLGTLQDQREKWYARAFLQTLSQRTGQNPGPKGGLSLWGMIINGKGEAGRFVELLKPFWADLLSESVEGGPCGFEHILVFYEEEQSGAANAYEIFWDDEDSPERQLIIRHHQRLPFAWSPY